jgi:hypothetical protein
MSVGITHTRKEAWVSKTKNTYSDCAVGDANLADIFERQFYHYSSETGCVWVIDYLLVAYE